MREEPSDTQPPKLPTKPVNDTGVDDTTTNDSDSQESSPALPSQNDFIKSVIGKIAEAENILITLSRDPMIDEIATAVGLAMFLEEAGKHTTAIYSGETPNVLEFLKPGETFETNTDSLQDFIIALNKEKADHLRYRIDGDYVKVYITPYKTTIGEDDLEFSHGDYNVDLVIALNVPTASDLDAALSEHGRIMHDASAIDITTGEPGRFGEIEWSDQNSSSVGEMIANLLIAMKKPLINKDVATALLAAIVSATNRFSNENTKSSTMAMAAKLMEFGADQQLVALNVMENSPAELIGAVEVQDTEKEKDKTLLTIDHSHNSEENSEELPEEDANDASIKNAVEQNIPEELKVMKPSAEEEQEPIMEAKPAIEPLSIEPLPQGQAASQPETTPNLPVEEETPEEPPVIDYSKMMEEALAESDGSEAEMAPMEPIVSSNTEEAQSAENATNNVPENTVSESPENLAEEMPKITTENISEIGVGNSLDGMSENTGYMQQPGAIPTGMPEGAEMPQSLGDDSYILDEPPKVIEPLPELPPPPVPQFEYGSTPSTTLPPVQPITSEAVASVSDIPAPTASVPDSDALNQLQQMAQPAQAVETPELPPDPGAFQIPNTQQ